MRPVFLIIACTVAICIANSHVSAQFLPPGYSATTNNYVRSWSASKPETDPNQLSATTTVTNAKMATQYFDGIGRSLQSVQKAITPTGKDLVGPAYYDVYDREPYKFLSYASSGTDGSFKLDPFNDQTSFYSDVNSTSPVKGQGETYYYGETVFEASPLNRVTQTRAPGNSWAGAGLGVETDYYLNTDIDLVKNWAVTNTSIGNFATYAVSTANSEYAAGTLYKTFTFDEEAHQVIEFKDFEGKIILKKTQLTASPDDGTGKNHSGLLCTYYIYDDLGNLRCVVPPAAVELVKASWSLSDATILSELCFRYEYDKRNRMIMKQVPGAQPVYMVYDGRDRLVMSQDGNLRAAGKWMVTVYDGLNRPVKTGLLTTATTFSSHLTNAASSTTYPSTASNFEVLTETYYDDYSWFSAAGISTWGAYSSSETSSGFLAASDVNSPFPQAITKQASNFGLVTGTKVKVINSSPAFYICTVNYYDEKNRLIQVKTNNISSATAIDITTNQYSFDGRLLISKTSHTKSGTNAQTHSIITTNTYDAAGRLTDIDKNVDGGGNHAIADYTYDELGQLITRKVGPAFNGNGGVTNLSYEYNIRGWILSCNRSQMLTDNVPSVRKFAYQIGYDKTNNTAGQGFTAARKNGNIAGIVWKSSGDGVRRKYDFTYDKANRLMQANFTQNDPGTTTWGNGQMNFSVKMGDGNSATSAYDNNGNIKRMQQWGFKGVSSTQIDDLTYNYTAKSNKLLNVSDAFNDAQTVMGDFRTSALSPNQTKTASTVDYTYDDNGNMLKDLNKDIGTSGASGIVYNYLNLPQTVTVQKSGGVKGTVSYTYDASGNKLKKQVIDYSTTGKTITTTTTYIGGFQYESRTTSPADANNPDYTDVLQFLGHEEGRIRRKTDGTFAWDYFVKDHLGNVRMVLTEESKVDYYPVATLETSNLPLEQQYYSITTGQIVDKSAVTGLPAYTNKNTIPTNPSNPTFDNANSSKLYKLNKNNAKTGLGITLKVMAGDKLDIYGKSYYFQNNTGGSAVNTDPTILSILTAFLGAPTGNVTATHGGITASQLNGNAATTSGITTMLGDQTTQNNTNTLVPKAFINYILFDEQFGYVSGGFAPVGANGVLTDYASTSALHNISVSKSGFVYIYCSNASPVDVFFDNLQVAHTRGTLLEETHYYPFGLTMAGISSKALTFGNPGNRRKWNAGTELENSEFNDGSGLELYATDFRTLDPQLGNFRQIDPMSDFSFEQSPFSFSKNNPLLFNDPLGLDADSIVKPKPTPGTTPDNPKVLPEVVVAHSLKTPLKGGRFNGQNISNIQGSSFSANGYSSSVSKKWIPHDQVELAFQKWITQLNRLSKVYGIGATLAGGSALDLQSIEKYKEVLKKLIKLKKINVKNPLMLAVATIMGIRADQASNQSEAIGNILSQYHIMNDKPEAEGAGIYIITESTFVGSMGGSGGTEINDFYDVSTKTYIGGTYEHY